jgi:hypothetical protein
VASTAITPGSITTLARDVGADVHRALELHPPPAVEGAGALHRLDRGGAGRDGRAGHHLDGLTRGEAPVRPLSGPHLRGHCQRARRLRGIARVHRVAVHGRAIEGRQVVVGADLLGQHAAESVRQRHLLGGQARGVREHDFERFVDWDHGTSPLPSP